MPTLTIPTPPEFNFWQTVYSHGWVAVKPHEHDEKQQTFTYITQLSDRSVWWMKLRAALNQVEVELDGGKTRLTEARRMELTQQIRHQLRLDDDLSGFYDLCRATPILTNVVEMGYGRVLRCATLWEDLVRVIATTNTTWMLTKRMIAKLVDGYGTPHSTHPEWRAFPSPSVVAGLTALQFKEMGWGYRGPYVIQNAEKIAKGEVRLEQFLDPALNDKEVRKGLMKLRGVGDYAAGTLMILLGRYSVVPVDTEARAAVSRVWFKGETVTDKQVKETLEPFQPYSALVLYCEYMMESTSS
jgi:N-glycosylase/DNA lyase